MRAPAAGPRLCSVTRAFETLLAGGRHNERRQLRHRAVAQRTRKGKTLQFEPGGMWLGDGVSQLRAREQSNVIEPIACSVSGLGVRPPAHEECASQNGRERPSRKPLATALAPHGLKIARQGCVKGRLLQWDTHALHQEVAYLKVPGNEVRDLVGIVAGK